MRRRWRSFWWNTTMWLRCDEIGMTLHRDENYFCYMAFLSVISMWFIVCYRVLSVFSMWCIVFYSVDAGVRKGRKVAIHCVFPMVFQELRSLRNPCGPLLPLSLGLGQWCLILCQAPAAVLCGSPQDWPVYSRLPMPTFLSAEAKPQTDRMVESWWNTTMREAGRAIRKQEPLTVCLENVLGFIKMTGRTAQQHFSSKF